MKRLLLSAAAALGLFAAQPASAADVILLTPGCDLVAGCKFSGNDNPVADVVEAYNTQSPAPTPLLSLTFLSKLEAEGDISGTSGTATSPTPFNYYVVKASNEFWLYKLSSAASSVSWNTANLTNKKGEVQSISHLSFYQGTGFDSNGGVPEPATWAMMIGGFGLVGGALRKRRAFAVA